MIRKKLWLMVLLLSSYMNVNAVIYYSRTSGGNWTDNSTWSTVTYGNSTNTGTFPRSGDYAYIGDGYTIIVNANCTTSHLIIGQGSTGVLEYSDAGNYNLVVINNVTINNGANLRYTGNNTRTHLFYVGNNLSNSGTVDLYSDANDVVNLIFYRAANSVVSGSGSFDLNAVTIQKLTSSTFTVEVQSTTFESGIRDLILTYGTFFHNNSSTYQVNTSAGSGFTIPADGVVRVNAGVLHLSPTQSECFLNGTITLTGGTLRIGSTSGAGGLRYEKPGAFNPRLDIQGGSMEIYGSLTHKTGASSSPLVFSMSGGTLLLNSGSTGSSSTLFHINDVAGSSCVMTYGAVVLQNPNASGTTTADVSLCGTNGTVSFSSGFIIFGNDQTTEGAIFTFSPVSGMSWPNLEVSGPAGAIVTLCPVSGNSANVDAISLHVEADKIFDVRSSDGTSGDSRAIKLTGNFDGINSLLCDGTYQGRSSELILEGGEGQQISGNGSLILHDLALNNSGGASLGMDLTITGTLNFVSGILTTSSSAVLTLDESATVIGAGSSSYIEGPLRVTKSSSGVGNLSFPIGKNGSYRLIQLSVNHSSGDAVVYEAEIQHSNPRDIGYSLPGSIDRISGVRYLTMSRTGSANLVSGTITMNYGVDDGVDDPSNLRIVHYTSGSSWSDLGGSGSSAGSGSITSGSFTSIGSLFALGNANGGTNPLPVTWLNFAAVREAGLVVLDWATASEVNADYYDIERGLSLDDFMRIGRVNAVGDISETSHYRYIDQYKIPDQATVYYRLRQVDRDGAVAYSKIAVVRATEEDHVLIYPVPAGDAPLNIALPDAWQLPARLVCRDLSGRICFERELNNRLSHIRMEPAVMTEFPAVWIISDNDGRLFVKKMVN